jgi:3-oxoacyl-(acyl-carrier-protein) synthase
MNVVDKGGPSRLRHALSNNFGFGGSNCTLIFSLAQ